VSSGLTGKIFDTHIHITPPEILNDMDKFRNQDDYFDLLSGSQVNKNITGDQVKELVEEGLLQGAVVFGFAFQDMELCHLVNSYTIKIVHQYPELIGFAVVNPRADNLCEELQFCKENGLRGVGEIYATGQDFDLRSGSHLEKLATFCRKNNWPILLHLNEPVGHYYKGKTKDSLQEGMSAAENFPDNIFIFAHLGGGLCFYELMPEVEDKLSNVYYDTAALPFLYDRKIYGTLKQAGLIKKLLLGSDFPLISPARYIDDIEKSCLNENDKQKIYRDNFHRLLGEQLL